MRERFWIMTSVLCAVFLILITGEPPLAEESAFLPDFKTLAVDQENRAIADCRWLHRHPELAGRERETQTYLRQQLLEIPGVELIDGGWGTGLVAVLKGGRNGPLVAWRADIDALPITETTGLPWVSGRTDTLAGREVGLMHACGHDIHMSVTLGAVRLLAGVREEMSGSLMIIFQPAEENGEGARAMIEAGVFDGGRMPKCILALHDHPTLETGQVGSCSGWATANVDAFRLTVKGKSGHGAYPHRAIDPVTIASQTVLALNNIVSRQVDVNRHCVISVGSIHGGTKSSIIPDEVVITATVRTHDKETRLALRDLVDQTARGISASAGAPEPELEYFFGTPAGYNDPKLVGEVRNVVRHALGVENDIVYPPGMGGEDFSRYGEIVPGFQFRLGVAPPGAPPMTLHSSIFTPDKKAIVIGIRIVSEILWDQLREE